MKNFKKCKKLLENGIFPIIYDSEHEEYSVVTGFEDDEMDSLKITEWQKDKEKLFPFINGDELYNDGESDDYENVNHIKYSVFPFTMMHKEIKGKVDIIDCPKIRKFAEDKSWNKDKIEMIGKTGFDDVTYSSSNYGQKYVVNGYLFPAWCITPNLEREEVKEMTVADVEKLVGTKVKIIE